MVYGGPHAQPPHRVSRIGCLEKGPPHRQDRGEPGGFNRSSQHGLYPVRRNWSSSSTGVFHPSVLRGLLFSAWATASSSLAVCWLRSVPLGKYCRSKPLVFSLEPRCQGLCGSQK